MTFLNIAGVTGDVLINTDHLAAVILEDDVIAAYLVRPAERDIVVDRIALAASREAARISDALQQVSLLDRIGVDKGAPSRFVSIGKARINLKLLHSLRSSRMDDGKTLYRATFVSPLATNRHEDVHLEATDAESGIAATIAAAT